MCFWMSEEFLRQSSRSFCFSFCHLESLQTDVSYFSCFCLEKKLSQTTSCHNGASKRMPGTEALIRKSPFQWRDPSLAIIMLSDPAKDPALSHGPQKEGYSPPHHHPSEKDACAKLHVTNSI